MSMRIVESTRFRVSLCLVALATAALVAGCANEPPVGSASAARAPAAAQPVAPAPPPAPEPPRVIDKPQAQRLAIEAVDMLQNGDEARARVTLERALALDPANDLAKKLMADLSADAQKELGTTFFRYTVQRDDSLSKLAQQYLGDRFRFYILAKYNDLTNPNRLAAGQVIRIPGKAPATPPRPAAKPVEAEPPVAAEPTPAPVPAPRESREARESRESRDEVAALMRKGGELQSSGNLEGAYGAYREAAQRDSSNADAARQRDAVKAQLVRFYDREATQAFQRQNLDLAITKWDRILELDPNNQKAKLERERALDLKKRLNEKFGAN